MKTLIKILLMYILFSTNLFAQDKLSRLSIGYGRESSCAAIDRIDDISPRGISQGMRCDNREYAGAFHLQYSRNDTTSGYVPVDLCVGVVYEKIKLGAYLDEVQTGRFEDRFYTLLIGMNVTYFKRSIFSLYGGMYVGGTIATRRFTANNGDSDMITVFRLNFQLIPLGIRLGDNIGVFAEGGWGAKGSFCVGLFANF